MNPSAPAIALRGHHLLCVLTFCGHGYTPAFTANMAHIVAVLGSGATVRIVAGADALCAPLTPDCGVEVHCARADVAARDRRALAVAGAALGRRLKAGDSLRFDAATLATLRAAFADGRLRAACTACPWADFCTATAAAGFAGARLWAEPDGDGPDKTVHEPTYSLEHDTPDADS